MVDPKDIMKLLSLDLESYRSYDKRYFLGTGFESILGSPESSDSHLLNYEAFKEGYTRLFNEPLKATALAAAYGNNQVLGGTDKVSDFRTVEAFIADEFAPDDTGVKSRVDLTTFTGFTHIRKKTHLGNAYEFIDEDGDPQPTFIPMYCILYDDKKKAEEHAEEMDNDRNANKDEFPDDFCYTEVWPVVIAVQIGMPEV